MLVVDTSAWIEWLLGTPLAEGLKASMPSPQACVVPTIVQHELCKWLLRERGDEAADEMIAYTR
jgi:hypothetical protein